MTSKQDNNNEGGGFFWTCIIILIVFVSPWMFFVGVVYDMNRRKIDKAVLNFLKNRLL